MSILSTLSLGDMPRPFNWYYATSTERTAALSGGTFVATDEGKFARQLDDDSLWMLKYDSSFSWVAVGSSGSGNATYTGTIAPGSLPGNEGDVYFNSSTGEIYRMNGGGSWILQASTSALSASNLTSGTVPDGRFPAALPAISGAALTGLPAPPTLASGTGNLNGSGVLSVVISPSAVALVAIPGAVSTGLFYATNSGTGNWSITSTAGIADSGVAVYWIAY